MRRFSAKCRSTQMQKTPCQPAGTYEGLKAEDGVSVGQSKYLRLMQTYIYTYFGNES